jgi:hypothetical protein
MPALALNAPPLMSSQVPLIFERIKEQAEGFLDRVDCLPSKLTARRNLRPGFSH